MSRECSNDFEYEDTKNPLVVNSCGYQKFKTRIHKITRNTGRVDYQIIYIVKGKGYYNFSGKTHKIGEGNIIVYLPGQTQFCKYDFKDSTELFWIYFTGSAVHDYLSNMRILEKQVHYVGVNNEIISIFKKTISELQLKRPKFENLCSVYLLELFTFFSILQLNSKTVKSSTDDAIIRLALKMHSKYPKKCSVNDFARICNLSLSRFTHKFKKEIGFTPVQYVTRIRIEEAKYMLSNSSLNITEISSVVGYDNPLYFSRIFKKALGVSPSLYKTRNNQILYNL
jgi:AraC-type DNA-binding domain-containing proteins